MLLSMAENFRGEDEVRIVVVSEGIGADWLLAEREKRGLDNLVLLPYQPFERLPEVLATGDVLIGVLEAEAGVFSVPSKVLTYLCARRPILLAVPEVNLAARIIDEQNAGITVSPSDEAAFVAAGEQFFHDQRMLSDCARNARAYAESTFDIDLIAEKFEDIIDDGSADRHSGRRPSRSSTTTHDERTLVS